MMGVPVFLSIFYYDLLFFLCLTLPLEVEVKKIMRLSLTHVITIYH